MTKQELSYRALDDNGHTVLRNLVDGNGGPVGKGYVAVRQEHFDAAVRVLCRHPDLKLEPEDEQFPRLLYGRTYSCPLCGGTWRTLGVVEDLR